MSQMLEREIRNYVSVVLGLQRAKGVQIQQAKDLANLIWSDAIPSEAEFSWGLSAPPRKNRVGRKRIQGLTKRDAIAALAAYFESVGAGAEQSISEAKRWLSTSISRRVAKDAIAAFKARTRPEDFQPMALWAYNVFRPETTQPLPERMEKVRKRRRTKSQLG